MKRLSIQLVALCTLLFACSTASAAVAVRVGPVRVAVGRPAARRAVVAPARVVRPVVRPAVVAPVPVVRPVVRATVHHRRSTARHIVHDRRQAAWGAVVDALQP